MPIFGPRYNTCANFITYIGFNFHLTILDPSCWSVLIRTNEFAYYFTGNFDPSARSTTASNASVIDMIKKGRVGAQPNGKFHKSLFFCWMMFHTQLNPQQALCIIILTGGHHKGAEFNSKRERERVSERKEKERKKILGLKSRDVWPTRMPGKYLCGPRLFFCPCKRYNDCTLKRNGKPLKIEKMSEIAWFMAYLWCLVNK